MRANIYELKCKYVPQRAEGKITNKELAFYLGMSQEHASRLVTRYKKFGKKCFINGHRGMRLNKKRLPDSERKKIVDLYINEGGCATYANFAREINDFYNLPYTKSTVISALKEAGIQSPEKRKKVPPKSAHRPRPERKSEGELIQIDGTPFDFFMNGKRVTAVGAIDDATHSLKGIYFCTAESNESYFELLYQLAEKNCLPQAFYTDWSSCFISTPKNKEKLSVMEKIAYAKEHKTEYMRICEKLGIKTIFALSPQAKGRVERMWKTLQKNIPMMFKRRNINSIKKANELTDYLCKWWDKYFSVNPEIKEKSYTQIQNDIDLSELFSVHKSVITKKNGIFNYCQHCFEVPGISWSGERLELLISYREGFYVKYNGKKRKVICLDNPQRLENDVMTDTEYNILFGELYFDKHADRIQIA